jgi:hypothetical protein
MRPFTNHGELGTVRCIRISYVPYSSPFCGKGRCECTDQAAYCMASDWLERGVGMEKGMKSGSARKAVSQNG